MVAAGVLEDSEGRILLTRRASAAHQGGLWEFPGGKVESGETVQQALARELHEELGVEVLESHFLLSAEHDYGDKVVRLEVYRVTQWRGEATGREQQPLAWYVPNALIGLDFPAANIPILERLLADQH